MIILPAKWAFNNCTVPDNMCLMPLSRHIFQADFWVVQSACSLLDGFVKYKITDLFWLWPLLSIMLCPLFFVCFHSWVMLSTRKGGRPRPTNADQGLDWLLSTGKNKELLKMNLPTSPREINITFLNHNELPIADPKNFLIPSKKYRSLGVITEIS